MQRTVLLGTGLLVLGACSGDSLGFGGGGKIMVNVATRPAAAAATASGAAGVMAAPPEKFGDPSGDSIQVDKVELVMAEIEFEQEDGLPLNVREKEITVGPILVDLPLGAGTKRAFEVTVDPGSWNEIKFSIRPPEDETPGDSAFRKDNPDFVNISVRVTGTFNGTAFTFTSNVRARQKIELDAPLVVTEGTPAEVTLTVDLDKWFRDFKGELIDPATALKGEPNEFLVKMNIRRSFHGFCDKDRDGCDDHGGPGRCGEGREGKDDDRDRDGDGGGGGGTPT